MRSPGTLVVLWLCTVLWIIVAPAFLSLLDVLRWRSLPFPEPARLVWINAGLDLAPTLAANGNFQTVASFEAGWLLVEGPGGRTTVLGATVDPPFFDVLGVRLTAGRTFSAAAPAEITSAVLSESLYRRLFREHDLASGPAVLRVEGRPLTVLGVIPDHPVFPTGAEVWVLRSSGVTVRPDFLPPAALQLGIVGRLARSATLASAYTAVETAALEVLRRTNVSSGDVAVLPFERILRWRGQGERSILQVCLAGLACLLLLATAGALSGFLLDRQNELAVRLALGARRIDLLRLVLVQLLVPTAPGLLAGLPISVLVLEKLAGLVPGDLAQLLPPAFSGRSLALALAGWVLVAGLSALFAWTVAAPGGPASLLVPDRRRARAQRPRVSLRLGALCIGLGLAMAFGGLAAVLRHSVIRLERQPLGFEPQGVATAVLRWQQAPAPGAAAALLDAQRRRFESIPSVVAVAFSDSIPFSSSIPQLEVTTADRTRSTLAYVQRIHGDYLATLGIRLVAGRDITPLEHSTGAAVVLLDEAGARTMFGKVPAPGHALWVGDDLMEVVGVVASSKVAALDEVVRPKVYRPLLGRSARQPAALAVLARLSSPVSAESFTRAADRPGMFLSQYRSMTAGIAATLANRRLARDLATLQWLATLAFVALAVFGTFSWWIETRSFELTVRLALGDTHAGIAKRIFRSAGWLGAGAVLLGLAAYVPAAQALRAFLYGVGVLSSAPLFEAVATAGAAGLAATALAVWSAIRRLSFDRLKP